MKKYYRICTRCIMDTSDPDIEFDESGICNHCRRYNEMMKKELHHDEQGQEKLKLMINDIKEKGKSKEYDCVIGVSGGVDSTYVAYLVKKRFGLMPLAVHVDNGWDTELSVKNIENLCKSLDIDLYTKVLDWEEFKDLQLSFLKSSISNCEIPTDHAIVATLLQVAAENGIRYILIGTNLETEGILPKGWGYDNRDWKLIEGIHKKFGKTKLKTYPHYTLVDLFKYFVINRIQVINILNYVKYNKKEAKHIIEQELGWKDYGGKHYESLYTRFFQGYILPKKFNIDKRRAHLSSLICSGQMTKKEALEEMKKDPYSSRELLEEDKEYVIKKLGLTEEEFEKIMSLPIKTFRDYPNNYFILSKVVPFVKIFAKKVGIFRKF